MGKTKLEAKQWLKEIGLADDVVESIAANFTAAQMTKIAEGTMRQDEFDRVMNEGKRDLETKQAELTAAGERLNAEIADWAKVQAEGGQVTQKMQADLDAAQQTMLKLQQTVRRMATDAGLDPEKVLAETGTTTVPTTPAAAAAAAGLTDADVDKRINTAVGSVAQLALRLPATLAKIAREHKALTGTDLDEQTIIAEIEKRAGTRGNQKSLDPTEIWQEMHDIPAKRAAAEQKRVDDLVAAAREEGRQAGLSEVSVPGAHTPAGRHAIVFNSGERKSALQRPQPGGTTTTALSALRSGKYRPAAAGGK